MIFIHKTPVVENHPTTGEIRELERPRLTPTGISVCFYMSSLLIYILANRGLEPTYCAFRSSTLYLLSYIGWSHALGNSTRLHTYIEREPASCENHSYCKQEPDHLSFFLHLDFRL